ncbi:MAG: AmmeMemoRadiSam system radical SAM enzyme [Spirochaetes bacterium]|nr:AmmeMemoRadiSam system radical SAM enzyme [Spirochaetota bacterium]
MEPAQAVYAEYREDGRVLCTLCHHACILSEGATGICGTRRMAAGRMILPWFGMVSSIAVDPIEKKPLFHYLPGSTALSLGFLGCNLRCPFCQNHRISQSTDAPAEYLPPDRAIDLAISEGSPSLAYTYSEPLIHAEYILACMERARKAGIGNILVTNGHAKGQARSDLLGLCDAANVDLKAWDPVFYRGELGGDREIVLDFIRAAVAAGVHVEITTLVIPGRNDEATDIEGIAGFISALDPGIPYHLSAYRPMYKYDLPPTPDETLERCASIARKWLHYVYVGNSLSLDNDTKCPDCGNVIVRRKGYRTAVTGLSGGRCAACARPIPIVIG